MQPPPLDPALGYLIVLGIALLFAVAAIHKVNGLAEFAEVLAAYRVLPESWARRLAPLIPGVELAAAAGLIWESTRRYALVTAMTMLLGYAAAIALNLARGRRGLDCGCGAPGRRRTIAPWMAWRNVLLALLLAIAALPWSARLLGGADLLTVAGGLAASLMLYMAVDRLTGDVVPRAMGLEGSA